MNKGKKRHGCLTLWLILMLLSNSVAILIYTFSSTSVRGDYPSAPIWLFPLLIIIGILNIVFIIALFRWEKWGLGGVIITGILSFIINLFIGLNLAQAVSGLFGLVILLGVLQIGKENKGWSQLK